MHAVELHINMLDLCTPVHREVKGQDPMRRKGERVLLQTCTCELSFSTKELLELVNAMSIVTNCLGECLTCEMEDTTRLPV